MKRAKKDTLQEVRQQLNEVNRQISDFQQLDEEALRYRPGPGRWSVLDCLEHINLFYADYFSRMEPAIHQAVPSGRTQYTPGFFARRMIHGLRPKQGKRTMKIKTFKAMTPATDEKTPEQIFDILWQYHARLEQLLTEAEALHWDRIKVASAIGPLLRFKLGDCFRLLMAHTERHLLQGREALKDRETITTKQEQ